MPNENQFYCFTQPILLVREGYGVVYNEVDTNFPKKEKQFDISKQRYTKKGLMSKTVKSKLKSKLRIMLNMLQFGTTKRLPTFVTLTLPAKQFTTDKQMNNRLKEFIQELKYKSALKNYVWKAEVQKNGNIHYHIIFDCFIHWTQINKVWNMVIERDGYVTKYRENNHKDCDTLPNNIDVHSLKSVNNAILYIAKYMTKGVDNVPENSDESQQPEKDLNDCNLFTGDRLIQAHIWGCSDELRKYKEPKLILTEKIQDELQEAVTEKVGEDYVEIYKFKASWKTTPTIMKLIRDAYSAMYKEMYYTKPQEIVWNKKYKIVSEKEKDVGWQECIENQVELFY